MLCFCNFETVSYHSPWCFRMFLLVFLLVFPVSYFKFCDSKFRLKTFSFKCFVIPNYIRVTVLLQLHCSCILWEIASLMSITSLMKSSLVTRLTYLMRKLYNKRSNKQRYIFFTVISLLRWVISFEYTKLSKNNLYFFISNPYWKASKFNFILLFCKLTTDKILTNNCSHDRANSFIKWHQNFKRISNIKQIIYIPLVIIQ